jgi:hypothetical protein
MTLAVTADNGRAPASALTVVPGVNGDGTPHTAPHVTAASYARVRAAMQAAGLGDLLPTANGWSCYRDRAAQQLMRDLGLTTIPVGQSIHGEWTYGSAVDFQDLGGFGAPRHEWLRYAGGAYGWYQPGWAQAGGSLPEPWHWEYDEHGDAHAGEGDQDMTPDEAQRLLNIEGAVGRIEQLWGQNSGRPHQADQVGDWSEQTTNAVGRVETNQSQLLEQLPAAATASRLAGLALIVAVAVLVAIVIELRTGDPTVVAYGGGGTLLGGLLAWTIVHLGRPGRRSA